MATPLRNEHDELIDLAVIGAGIYGIQAARTYLELYPTDNVVIFEASGDVGGVWSTERVYDAFWTQTSLRILEFSDMPLEGVPDYDTYHGFFPAKYVAQYLKTYVEHKIFDGRSLASRIVLHSKVDTITKVEKGWIVHVKGPEDKAGTVSEVTARKIIDGTGLTSCPNIPSLPGQNAYKGRTLHSIDFAQYQKRLLYSGEHHSIAVIGGAKSGADIAYACAKAGHKVTWIIRRSGAGPAAFVAAEGGRAYSNSNEAFYTRFMSHFLVSYFFDESKTWLGQFLYGTWLGKKLIQGMWRSINTGVGALADFERADGKDNGFYNLRPDTDIFWQNDSTGICQRADFFDIIARNMKIYREDPNQMTANGIELADGTFIESDVMVFATGWKRSHPKIQVKKGNDDTTLSLGLSKTATQEHPDSKAHWFELESSAKKEMLARFPILQDQPPHHQVSEQMTPLRLYKGILPINDRSIAFVGQMLTGNNFRMAEVQALYAVAAFDGSLPSLSKERMEVDVARTVVWDRLRYLTKGQNGDWIYWDMVPYTDNLLQELGLASHRYKSYWKDLFAPCYASELRNLIDEYRSKLKSSKVGNS